MTACGYWTRLIPASIALLAGILGAAPAQAIPSMARQTGYPCSQCHVGYPELTNFGRQFKLGAYAMTSDKWDEKSALERVPLSGGLQVSRTSTSDVNAGGTSSSDFPQDRKVILQTAAIYYGGRITENSGALVQYNYSGIEKKWGMEMFDARYARETSIGGKEVVIGLTLNNSPTVSDIYNSTPSWGFPHTDTAASQMPAATLIDMTLAGKVAGLTAYMMWDDTIYAEVGAYRTAKSSAFRVVAAGQDWNADENLGSIVKGNAPYWRIALQRVSGPNTYEIGTYGMSADVWQDASDTSLGASRFRDVAVDAHYHYRKDSHSASIGGTYIHERKTWSDAAQAAGMTSNASDTLNTLRVDLHYYYQLKWGGGLQYFRTTGSTNDLAYNTGDMLMGSANGSPNSRGWKPELNYFPTPNLKLAVRYTRYSQFNGASTNYNGSGRNASANNSLYLLAWYLF